MTKDLLFSTSHDKTARVWHSKITKSNRNRALIRTFKVSVKLFSTRQKLCETKSQGHSNGVYPLVFIPGGLDESDDEDEEEDNAGDLDKDDENLLLAQGDCVVTGSADTTAKVWSLYSGECLHVSTNQICKGILPAVQNWGPKVCAREKREHGLERLGNFY